MKFYTLDQIITESAACAAEKGWDDEPRSANDDLLLIHSEVSEATEELRMYRAPDEIYYEGNLGTARDPLSADMRPGVAKPCGVPTELADVVIRCCHMAKRHGIDLVQAVNLKLAYNRTRPRRHGGKKF